MGWTNLFESKPPSLATRVASMTLDRLEAGGEQLRGKPEQADAVFALAIMTGAGHFVTQCLPSLRPLLGKANSDTAAFEALAFNLFALRAAYPKVKQREEVLVDEGFRTGGLVCLEIANARFSAHCSSVFFPRVFEYRNRAKKDGIQGAVRHFTEILFKCRGAKLPVLNYGATTELYNVEIGLASVGVMIFATTMPSGIARSLKIYIDDADLLHTM